MLCLSLILSHQTVAYGCVWCTRTLLLAIPEQSSLTYTPSNTCALLYTTLNAHPHTHPPHSIHRHSKLHHSQNSHIIHSTHTQIHLHLSAPPGSPIHMLLPRFSGGWKGKWRESVRRRSSERVGEEVVRGWEEKW